MTSGDNNVFVGFEAASNQTTARKSSNTFLG